MRCAEVRDLLGNYLDAELSDSMMQRIERHLLRCPQCAYEAHSMDQVRYLLRRWLPQPMVSEALGERVLRRIVEHFAHLQQSPISEDTSLPLPLDENGEK